MKRIEIDHDAALFDLEGEFADCKADIRAGRNFGADSTGSWAER